MVKKGPFFQEKWGKGQGGTIGRGFWGGRRGGVGVWGWVFDGFLKERCGNLRNRGGG